MPDFPLEKEFEDFKCEKRTFEIKLYKPEIGGYSLIAREILDAESPDGYEFRSYSATSVSLAYTKLRKKINQDLSVRYLKNEDGQLSLTHDKINGKVGYNGIIVDGDFVPFEDLTDLIQTYEGFNIKIEISDPSNPI